MDNQLKAEKTIKIGNTEYKARMSLDTIARIEDTLGFSIMKLGEKLVDRAITQTQCLKILTLCVRAGGNNVEEKDIWSQMSRQSLVDTVSTIGELFASAFPSESSSQDSQKKS